MARIDKTDSAIGVFRAPLAADYVGTETPIGVGLDVNGRVVAGAGVSGIVGLLVRPPANPATPLLPYKAGINIDVLTTGELTEFAGVAGTRYTANTTTGVISSAAASATQIPIGWTVEATRLVVRVSAAQS
jgi:hypothetical protein